MAQQTLNDGVSFGEQRSKINSNFTELYSTKTTNSNAAITGGIINGTSIGQTTPAPGSFTTLSASGTIWTSSGLDLNNTVGGTWSNYAAADGSVRWYKNSDRLILTTSGLSVAGSGTFGGNVSATGRLSTAGIAEDASGNIGIGVTPSAWLGSYKVVQLAGGAIQGGATGLLEFYANNYRDTNGDFIYLTAGGASKYAASDAHRWFTAPSGTAGQPISFTQAMTLDASGNLLVGATDVGSAVASGGAQIYTHAYGYGKTVVDIGHIVGTENGTGFQRYFYSGIAIGSVTQNGTTSVSYNTTSDHRLKTNIRPANAGRFMEIEFVDFEWVDGRHDCGVIAHQLASVYPDLVVGEKDATEIRQVEINPAVPAVTEQVLITEAVLNDDGEEVEPAVYETVEVTPAVDAVFEDQEFPVYQQVNYIGLIGRMGTRLQAVIRENEELKAQMASVLERLDALESA